MVSPPEVPASGEEASVERFENGEEAAEEELSGNIVRHQGNESGMGVVGGSQSVRCSDDDVADKQIERKVMRKRSIRETVERSPHPAVR